MRSTFNWLRAVECRGRAEGWSGGVPGGEKVFPEPSVDELSLTGGGGPFPGNSWKWRVLGGGVWLRKFVRLDALVARCRSRRYTLRVIYMSPRLRKGVPVPVFFLSVSSLYLLLNCREEVTALGDVPQQLRPIPVTRHTIYIHAGNPGMCRRCPLMVACDDSNQRQTLTFCGVNVLISSRRFSCRL